MPGTGPKPCGTHGILCGYHKERVFLRRCSIHARDGLRVGSEVSDALHAGKGVVALESAVLTHGLPHPSNIEALEQMGAAVRDADAVPAVCLVHGGRLWIGATDALARQLAGEPAREKASVRDLGRCAALGLSAGLTVSATLFAAHLAGIRVFATGGIGGVHTGASDSGDISADLLQLSRTPVVTVCSGAKSVLDIPRTLEFLEMAGVPVYSYRTRRFPAFYLTDSGAPSLAVESVRDIAAIARMQWDLGYSSGIVIGNPVPDSLALPRESWELWLAQAQAAAQQQGIAGKDVTPFLLASVAESSEGRTVDTNLSLLQSNARLAGEIAVQLSS